MIYRTGRNVTFSVKSTRETRDAFHELARQNGWKAGETFEKAVDALRRQVREADGLGVVAVSQPKYFVDMARNTVKMLAERDQVKSKTPQVYQALINNLFMPQRSLLLNDLLFFLDQQTQGRWLTGFGVEQLAGFVQPWMNSMLAYINRDVQQQSGGFGQQPMLSGGRQTYGFGFQSQFNANLPPVRYDTGSRRTEQSAVTPASTPITTPGNAPSLSIEVNSNYDLGAPPELHLCKASNAELPQTTSGVLRVSKYFLGEYEKKRVVTSEITLRVPQNNASDAVQLVFNTAPQEVVRGLFANVVLYDELFYLPTGYQEFLSIAKPVWEAYSKDNNWRDALKVLNSRTKSEWELINQALTPILDGLIYRRIRANEQGIAIYGIENLEDLSDMDDRTSKYAVTWHSKYWSVFNSVVNRAIEDLFDPENLIGPDDKNFGDFVHCDKIAFYENERSKFDYGTFDEKVDQRAFIDRLMASNTVLRMNRAAILTNAMHSGLIARVNQCEPPKQMLQRDVNTVGTELIGGLDYLHRGNVETVLCLEQGSNTSCGQINIGMTLDDDVVLLR
ncbi:MAG: hypothetical protein P4L99_00595 [Chthoniobacter sp.]|nr:hypothetical protein [Chthoniobacter sp.]